MTDFTQKRVGETVVLTVDYTAILPTGVTIVSALWTNSVVPQLSNGADSSPGAMIDGAATISDAKVLNLITGGVAGLCYAPICTAMCSDGEVLILPDPGMGHLQVVC
jgi:hypothetical protein